MWSQSTYIRALQAFLISVFCALFFSAPALAQTVIERLVSPGPLSQAHKEFEKDCGSCHLAFDKKSQTSRCLDCHDEIAFDFDKEMGFHGKSPDISGTPCKTCHTEHEGGSFDIAKFDHTAFDHALTDYPLKGGHLNIKCVSCHLPDKPFHDAPTDCLACHKKDEPHKGRLGKNCQSCHNESDWTDVSFDHGKTNFPLFGKHKEAACGACHIDEVYEGLASKCIDCHKEDDTHEGAFGDACEDCHQPAAWIEIEFNHQKNTGFALTGGHAVINCATCHTTTLFEPKLSQDCVSCHRKDDSHKGRNGPACADCHITSSWTATNFDHNKNTKFALRGAHSKVACEGCHLESVTKKLPGDACIDCHREDDPHKGGQGDNCASCHNEISWVKNTRFDHDLSRFPLLGKHASAECSECHLSKRFQDASIDCVSCHAEDDKHGGALGESCGLCHNPNDWALWIFNHDQQTDFSLTGAHEGLACESCHRAATKNGVSLSGECVSCHRADDKHRGQYGADCERCHTTSDFKSIKFP